MIHRPAGASHSSEPSGRILDVRSITSWLETTSPLSTGGVEMVEKSEVSPKAAFPCHRLTRGPESSSSARRTVPTAGGGVLLSFARATKPASGGAGRSMRRKYRAVVGGKE